MGEVINNVSKEWMAVAMKATCEERIREALGVAVFQMAELIRAAIPADGDSVITPVLDLVLMGYLPGPDVADADVAKSVESGRFYADYRSAESSNAFFRELHGLKHLSVSVLLEKIEAMMAIAVTDPEGDAELESTEDLLGVQWGLGVATTSTIIKMAGKKRNPLLSDLYVLTVVRLLELLFGVVVVVVPRPVGAAAGPGGGEAGPAAGPAGGGGSGGAATPAPEFVTVVQFAACPESLLASIAALMKSQSAPPTVERARRPAFKEPDAVPPAVSSFSAAAAASRKKTVAGAG